MVASFSVDGMEPVVSEVLMMLVMRGMRTWMEGLRRGEGMGSR